MLLLDLPNLILDHLSDYAFLAILYPILWLTKIFIHSHEFLFIQLPVSLFVIFLGVVFTQPSSKFYWRRLLEDPKMYIQHCSQHILFKLFSRGYISLLIYMFLLAGVIKSSLIFFPEEGEHIRDMLTKSNIAQGLGLFSLFTLMAIYLKATFYMMLGIVKNWWDFKLKMILW